MKNKNKLQLMEGDEGDLISIDPIGLISSKRLDLIVRYYFFCDLKWNNISDVHRSLYAKIILSKTGGIEKINKYSYEQKIGMDAYFKAAASLYESMKNNGFNSDYYVPISLDGGLINGAHRTSCAIALNETIWARYVNKPGRLDFDFSFFKNDVFSEEDRIRILRGFADLHKNSGLFILYEPIREYWERIQHFIAKEFDLVGYSDIDFTYDYIGFRNLITDLNLYSDKEIFDSRLMESLIFSRPVIRVILVSDGKTLVSNDNDKEYDVYKHVIEVKQDIINRFGFETLIHSGELIHISGSYKQFDYLKRVVLSVNNLRCLHMRIESGKDKSFQRLLKGFIEWIDSKGYDKNDFCILGDAILEVFNLGETKELSVIVSHKNCRIEDFPSFVKRDSFASKVSMVSDDQIVEDDNCHFLFNGLKFANPEIVFDRALAGNDVKSAQLANRLSCFLEFYKFFDDKKILMEQVKKELKRRELLPVSIVEKAKRKAKYPIRYMINRCRKCKGR